MLRRTFPSPEALRRLPFGLADIALIMGTLVLVGLIARVGAGALISFVPPDVVPSVSLDPGNLPYYAGRSTLRMFIALFCSTLFTLIYGYIAAKSRRAERVLIPLLDILQSVPVLGFLSITVTGFIALFPGSLLGLEAASIFAIFTSQVWNMTFSFYQSLRTVPSELDEVARLYRLSQWQRFTKLEVPSATIGLLWNAMMSFGGGWFFVAASEAISVLNQKYTLPGLGSYVAAAVTKEDLSALGWALVAIAVVILLVDQLFWRPLIAWADKFRSETSAAAEAPESWLLDLFKAARLPSLIVQVLTPVGEVINGLLSSLTPPHPINNNVDKNQQVLSDRLYNFVLLVVIGALVITGLHFIFATVGFSEVVKAFLLGLLTLGRVVVLLIVASLIWTPIGVAIGFNPKLARLLQPVVQFLASFPANFIFPFATLFFIRTHISINFGSILLMSLGAQWYILFNSIAGAMSIPTDLREMATDVGLHGSKLWRKLIIPGIFSSWVTGGVTASGGAWNASIVSEIVSWGQTTLIASGLGAYIAEATQAGDWPRITLGIGMMSLYVVGINRLFWRWLYHLAETKYHL
ncbi:sulfonate ABC transporter permease [Nostoc linckia z18]|uniref:Sulfonate ABC transporter permease n=2 Tax=Nostoc linckia TaxID=92942 RepID=A0A9Q6EH49_NOSLI|nr:ABC transporter permease subunit [Nostoc linckia]PHK29225.1 sulfonate ABC transporter permease [Nostoc linckia z15]PHK44394.1 sulfonate ABC transporter permease [Nostoc linckia z16]PHJ58615.1 sulfonate ABC transporter permease [Nostoc linckia z1]PHJ61329.1 sulfonate ABC transporter permease [Nostoc linckia z3]PHJ71434.1 sulfonate ABC transporter permease [Nostoc linckia z4]